MTAQGRAQRLPWGSVGFPQDSANGAALSLQCGLVFIWPRTTGVAENKNSGFSATWGELPRAVADELLASRRRQPPVCSIPPCNSSVGNPTGAEKHRRLTPTARHFTVICVVFAWKMR